MTAAPPLLPEGGCLLHIGPYKTGSTAIQTALFDAREAMAEHGVAYPGRWRRAMRPGWAVLGYTPRGRRPTPISVWEEFSAEVRGSAAEGLRVCVSTEDFGSAGPPRIARIVEDLGGDRVHVVAVARRLDRLLPSQWQERVKSHDTITFDDWLRRVLGDDVDDREHQRFWASHDLVATADRWVPAVGRDRFTLVAADESDPDVIPRVFEQMLGLPEGLLALPPASNPSLSSNATELVRRVNELFETEGWPDATYHRMVQQGAVQQIVAGPRPAAEEPIPSLPRWAAERAAELSEKRAAELRDRGVRVVGDPERLRVAVPADDAAAGADAAGAAVAADARAADARAEVVAIETAVRAVAGLVESTIAESNRAGRGERGPQAGGAGRKGGAGTSAVLEAAGGRELVRALVRRVRHRARRSP